jgi:hypothetical protein
MDIAAIAKKVVVFLTPFLPYLVKAGEKTAEGVGDQFGEAAWEKAQALWGKLRGQEQIEEAAKDAAAMPKDADAQAALRLQLKKAFKENDNLAEEVETLMQNARAAEVQVTAGGDRSVAVGGNVNGSHIITSDGNVIGNYSKSEINK